MANVKANNVTIVIVCLVQATDVQDVHLSSIAIKQVEKFLDLSSHF